ncbi:hypothetical protein NDI76_22035 [Halogeometricum sp. S1BR25-6]|uniref:Uncharacterized protein n=1 Tax=Halogeometricum salsisoli TaxID=2950536 RepID=A0ABU2GKQ8_9EURY|nr:hypothetical protein [Halogeometricum sp. S1BR25-6]MDS0301413.1 hypothetical protein [Halogeometricum sp. S1BR25-6]
MREDSKTQNGTKSLDLTRRRLIQGTGAIAITAGALPLLSGTAAAHFPTELDIDVQPGNEENFIDLDEHESVEVVVHPTQFVNSDGEMEMFDPVKRAVRYRFGSWTTLDDGNGARPLNDGETVETSSGHGNQESEESLSLEFPVADMGLEGDEDTVWLYWERDESGEHGYGGVGKVRVYGNTVSDQDLVQRLIEVIGDTNEST